MLQITQMWFINSINTAINSKDIDPRKVKMELTFVYNELRVWEYNPYNLQRVNISVYFGSPSYV